jgi:hypothetical protein
MYNVTFRRIRATVVAMENQWMLHSLSVCICSLRHPSCNAHAPYCHLWPAPLYNMFPHYLINGTIFEREKRHWTYNVCFNLLVTRSTNKFNIQQLYVLPTLYLCFVNSDLCHLQHKLIGFITEMKSVYSTVRTGPLNKAVCAPSLKG